MTDPIGIVVPYEPYDNEEIATMTAIDFLMSKLKCADEKERVASWVYAKFGKKE